MWPRLAWSSLGNRNDLGFLILLLPKGWNYRCVPPNLFLFCAEGFEPRLSCVLDRHSTKLCLQPHLICFKRRTGISLLETSLPFRYSPQKWVSYPFHRGHSWHVPSHITSLKTWNPVSHFEFCYLYTKFLSFPHASQNMSGVKWDEFDTPSCRPSRSESDSWLPYIVVWPQARTWPSLTSFFHLFHTLRIK